MTLLSNIGGSLDLLDALRAGLDLAQDAFVFAALPAMTVVFGLLALDAV